MEENQLSKKIIKQLRILWRAHLLHEIDRHDLKYEAYLNPFNKQEDCETFPLGSTEWISIITQCLPILINAPLALDLLSRSAPGHAPTTADVENVLPYRPLQELCQEFKDSNIKLIIQETVDMGDFFNWTKDEQLTVPIDDCLEIYANLRLQKPEIILGSFCLAMKDLSLDKELTLSIKEYFNESPEEDSGEIDVSPKNLFLKREDYFEIKYQGKLTGLKSSKGLKYIAEVLGGQTFQKPLELYQMVNPPPSDTLKTVKELPEDIHPSDWESSGLDQKAELAYIKSLKELSVEREAAKKAGDENELGRIDIESSWIEKELSSQNHQGKHRRRSPEQEKARKAISVAIRRAIKKIKLKNPKLADHLKTTLLPISYPFKYSPLSTVAWKTS